MGSSSSKFRKHLQAGDEVQALELYRSNSELRKALDPNCSYGDSHQHETPLHLAAKHGMQTLLGIFLFSKGGNPKKTNARKETCLHCVCMETNAQSIHVDKRRADCLGYLLKWRGATLAEGQIEKVDLAAQDEKLNTALHYAAASGLAKCVEVWTYSPLFSENEEGPDTPATLLNKSGHAQIALYLESNMVLSMRRTSGKDNFSMPPVEEYSGLRPQDLQEAKDHLLVETADMLSVPLFTAEALLRNHEWSREMLLESWMNDPVACCEKCGVTPPSTLFSDKPQVQEDLASPLPSPSHKSPSPQDAECNICANTFLIADEPVHMTCTHQFCQNCWERYLNVKIQEGDAHRITCPAYNCTMLVPIDIIERIVSRDMALRYLQFDIKAFVDSNPDMKWCPYPACGRAVKLPDLDLGSNSGTKRNKIPSDTSRGVDCGVGHYFCWECLEESHEPCSCENWSRWFQKINEVKPETLDGTEQETELAANCLWLVTNSKPCPNCKSPIQKNEGCNHMKCSKCKYDFCWVCLEQWKRHNSSTGGYFKCNRYEVLKKVEEQSAQMVSEAEVKNRNMQELNRFVHYYTRFKNHENSYKLEEPLLQTVKDKMMKLAEAVTDNATAHAETRFVEDAVQQLLKARRVLKCSYVYAFYLDGPGYKKIVFEFMQTELEECTEILSQMVNRLYLRTPRRKIMEQAHIVQRKRLEFIMAISKGLVPPETPPSVRKSKMKRKISGTEAEDEDLRKAIVASIQEVDPSNPWIKDASGRHTNVMALLRCHRSGCNKVRVKNPRTNEQHDFCSRWCMQVDKEDQSRKEAEGLSEIILDEHMELLRALEMSRLQYLRDNGLLHVSESPDAQQSTVSKNVETRSQSYRHRPRSNSAGQAAKLKNRASELSSMKELDIELQRFHELSSGFPRGEQDETDGERVRSLVKSKSHHCHKLKQSSRFDECRSTVVPRVPNKSVEDLYCLDQASKPSPSEDVPGQEEPPEATGSLSASVLNNPRVLPSDSVDSATSDGSCEVAESHPSSPLLATSDEEHLSSFSSVVKNFEFIGSMFGAIKDISVSNIHSDESDKTTDFLRKDLASIFAAWDAEGRGGDVACSGHKDDLNAGRGHARRPLTLEDSSWQGACGVSSTGTSQARSRRLEAETTERFADVGSPVEHGSFGRESQLEDGQFSSRLHDLRSDEEGSCENSSDDKLYTVGDLPAQDVSFPEVLNQDEDSGTASQLEIADKLLQARANAHSHIREAESSSCGLAATPEMTEKLAGMQSPLPVLSQDTSATTKNNDKGDMKQQTVSIIVQTNTSDTKDSQCQSQPINKNTLVYELPRDDWTVGDEMPDKSEELPVAGSEAVSTEKVLSVLDSNNVNRKLSVTDVHKSYSSRKEEIADVHNMNDPEVSAHEFPEKFTYRSNSLGSNCNENIDPMSSEFRLNDNRALGIWPAHVPLQQHTEMCIAIDDTSNGRLTCDKTIDMSGNSCQDIIQTENSEGHTHARPVFCSSTNPGDSTAKAMKHSPEASSIAAAGAKSPEFSVESEAVGVEYSLRRHVVSEKQSSYGSLASSMPRCERHSSTPEIEITNTSSHHGDDEEDGDCGAIASSALINDAYETATSDDNWEDAHSVLPVEDEQSAGADKDHEKDDSEDLLSVYV
ncbi:unnamed protein product [Candidula unifasciata]|uniref:RBR-type E3 ubiquitin transferase n=1 Tax=Candidula unifasciata TaxID=100452 RepID=A0A8S3YM05_9EUPU|nr:unnamed protein product [Candidula unifasciata]